MTRCVICGWSIDPTATSVRFTLVGTYAHADCARWLYEALDARRPNP